MKTPLLLLSLIVATNAFAVRLQVKERMELEPVASPRKAKVLADARAAFSLPDGSQWITHGTWAEREPGAIGVTRFGADGSERLFLLSDFLPQGSIPRGRVGQIYGVATLDDRRVAVSGGWTDGRESHNAIVILRPRHDGSYETERVNEVPGVRQIVAAPRNTVLAVTTDATARDGGPLLTLYDTAGRVRARLGPGKGSKFSSAAEAARNASNAHLRRVTDTLFACYDPAAQEVAVFAVDVREDEVIVTGRNVPFVGDDASTAHLPVIGIEAFPNGDVLVARTGAIAGRVGTQLTVYAASGPHAVKQSIFLDRPWNQMLRENGRIHGVVRRGGIALDPVGLELTD